MATLVPHFSISPTTRPLSFSFSLPLCPFFSFFSLRSVFRVRSPTWRYWNETAELSINNRPPLNYYRTFRPLRVAQRPHNRRCRRRCCWLRRLERIAPEGDFLARIVFLRRVRIYRRHEDATNERRECRRGGMFYTRIRHVRSFGFEPRDDVGCSRRVGRPSRSAVRRARQAFVAEDLLCALYLFLPRRTKNTFTTANAAIKAYHDVKRVHAPRCTRYRF